MTSLLADANDLFNEADAALENKDLSTYAQKTEEARAKIQQAEQLLADDAGTPTEGTTSTSILESAASA